jgi:hypothetical protein
MKGKQERDLSSERLNCRRCVNKEERCLMQLLWEKY